MIQLLVALVVLNSRNFQTEGYQYKGCYDVSSGGLSSFHLSNTGAAMTTIDCMTDCVEGNNQLTATTLDSNQRLQCYCGNDNQATVQVADTECGIPCPLISSDTCGGINRLAVYQKDATDTVPLSVQPIFPVETTTESHYLLDTTVDSAAQNQPSVTQSSSTTNTCYCPCNTVGSKWDYLLNGTYTLDELKVILHDELEELRREVAIDKSHTLAAIYRKRCMNDDRPTSKVMGAFGAVMMCIPVALIVISDIAGFICRRRGQYSLK